CGASTRTTGRSASSSSRPRRSPTRSTRVASRPRSGQRRDGPPHAPGASLAKEASARRAGQYKRVRPSDPRAASCRQRRHPSAELGFAEREPKGASGVRVVAVIDGEHYAPVVRDALDELPYEVVAALLVGG